jgi:subtilisin family serine protease
MSSQRRRLAAVAALAVVAALSPVPAQAAPAATHTAAVDPRLLQEFGSADKVTFFVDLADAGRLDQNELDRLQRAQSGRAGRVARTTEVVKEKVAHADRTQQGLRALLRERGVAFKTFWISNTVEVTGDLTVVRELAARPDVSRISLPAVAVTKDPVGSATSSEELPWGLTHIGANKVWDQYGVHGEGVVVGSVDTGVQYDHPALVRQFRGTNGDGTVTQDHNWFDATGTCPDPRTPCDDVGHGTHTVGTMVGDDGAGHAIGVAPGARWIAAKGCQIDGCTEEALLSAGQWMLAPTTVDGKDPRPDLSPDIVNNSWGGPNDGNRFYDDIITAWTSAGIFPVFSNGNDGEYGCGTTGYPAANSLAYAVGAYGSNGAIASFSSRGADGVSRPDIAAPGVDVLSSVPGGGYATNSGTSMAAPHVAGTVALLWSAQPNLRRDVQATRELLDRTAHDVDDESCGGTAADNNVYGEGTLDAYALVQAATGGQHGGVTVTVTGNGKPTADALVTLTSAVVTRTARTDSAGRVELGRVPAGDYTLTVAHFGQLTRSQQVTVAAGTAPLLTVDLSAAAPWHRVTGVVRDPSGRPLAGVPVKLAGEPVPGFVTDSSGRFTGQLPEGRYDLLVDYGRWLAPKTVTLTVDGDETLDVRLDAKSDHYGHVVGETAARFTDGGHPLRLTDGSAPVKLPFPVTFYGTTYRAATVHTDGYLAFSDTASIDAFRAGLVLDRHSQIRTRTTGSGTSRTFAITWTGARIGSRRVDLQILLSERGPVTVQFRHLPQDAPATVGIRDGGQSLAYATDQPVLTDKIAVTFVVPGFGLLRGRVLDANDGKPLADAAVRVSGVSTATGSDGVYQVEVPAAKVAVSVVKPAYEDGSSAVSVTAGAVRTADVRLRTALLTAPSTQSVTVKAGSSASVDIALRNRGGLPATFDARELNGAAPPSGEPGHVLGSFPVPDFYNAYGVDWHDGKVIVSDTYFWGRVERFTPDGTSLGKGAISMNGWPSDMTSVPSRNLVCAPSMSVVGDLPIVCFDRETLEVKETIPTPSPGRLYYGLAYRAADDTFYLAGDYAIRHIAGLSHSRPGEVLGQCTPAVPWTAGIELNEKQNVLWSINQDNQGEEIRALDPDTCTELGWAPDPDADELSGAGITVDDKGDLWTVGGTRAPYRAEVYHLSGALPVYSDVPWLSVAAPTGSVPAGQSAKLRVTVDASTLKPGRYTGTLLLISNGAKAPMVPVTVSLTVR